MLRHLSCRQLVTATAPQSKSIMSFGKYKGQTYAEIFGTDPDYCRWVVNEKNHSSNGKSPGRHLKEFAAYVETSLDAYSQPLPSSVSMQPPVVSLDPVARLGNRVDSYTCTSALRQCKSVDQMAQVIQLMEANNIEHDDRIKWTLTQGVNENKDVIDKVGALRRLMPTVSPQYVQYLLKTATSTTSVVACLNAVKKWDIEMNEFLRPRMVEAYFHLNDNAAAATTMKAIESETELGRTLKYCAQRGWNEATQVVFDEFKKRDFPVTEFHWAQVMRSYSKARKFEQAMAVYDACSEANKGRLMKRELIDLYCRSNKIAEVEKEIANSSDLDISIVNPLLHVYASQGNSENAEKLVAQMLPESLNKFTYNALLRVNRKANNFPRMQHWFQLAKDANCVDGWSYFFMMHGRIQHGGSQKRPDELASLFDEMISKLRFSEINSGHKMLLNRYLGPAACRERWPSMFLSK